MMSPDEVKQICNLSEALWSDTRLQENRTVETLSAVSLLNLSAGSTLERLCAALLERADRDGTRAHVTALGNPFYRLYAIERLVLVVLHRCRWSYSRTARVLKISEGQVAEMAWQARLHLVPPSVYPVGSGATLDCPPYSIQDPWTQRFLDGECLASEKNALQSHMMECDHCRDTMQRCRMIYYQVDRCLPAGVREDSPLFESLMNAAEGTQQWLTPTQRTFYQSLEVFTQRADVRVALLALTAMIAASLWKNIF